MNKETPWRVICPKHGPQCLSRAQYDAQMAKPDLRWQCPLNGCRRESNWDDDHYENHYLAGAV